MEQRRSQFDRDGLPAEAIRDPGSDPTTPVARGRRRAPARGRGVGAGAAAGGAGCGPVAGVRILVDLVDGAAATGRARENAASALLNLVMAGGESAVEEVLAVGGAEEAVRELAEDQGASARGKAKAEALLRALEDGAAAGNRRRREHRFADFLDGLVLSDPYFSSPASAATHDG